MAIVKIEDLAGLSKPLTRLIEVISAGIGAVSKPYLTRKNAEASAHKIQILSDALGKVADSHQLPVVFNDGEIQVWQRPDDGTLLVESPDIAQRSSLRADFQERKRQNNVEIITTVAASELAGEESVPDESPDSDWISRFFRAAEDVSSEQMQDIWGRILAGEIKKPGSYSLKTLDFVKNLTASDAKMLEHVARVAVTIGTDLIIPSMDLKWLVENREVYEGHQFAAAELGAMYPQSLNYKIFHTPVDQAVFISGKQLLIVTRGANQAEINLPIWRFSGVGREILQLISNEGDKDLLYRLGQFFLEKGATAKIAEIIEHLPGGRVRHTTGTSVEAA